MNISRASTNSLLTLAAIASLAIYASPLAAQAIPICSSVTAEEAASLLGVPGKRTADPSGCDWEDAAHKNQLSIAYLTIPSMFTSARTKSATTGTVKDEPGLGNEAFSTIPTSYKGSRVAMYCRKGTTVLILDLKQADATDRLPQMRELMRKMVARVRE